jgi:hypothetical protein
MGGELGVSVTDNSLGKSEPSEYMFHVESSDFCSGDSRLAW